MKATDQERRFFERVLAESTVSPVEGGSALCRAWQELTNAKLACLWLFNDLTKHWEVVAYSPEDFPLLPPMRGLSLTEYSSKIREPVMVNDIETWATVHQKVSYRVALQAESGPWGCKSVLCVPLLSLPQRSSQDSDDSTRPPIRGAICCYFEEGNASASRCPNLDLLGQLSAWAIGAAHEAEQRSVLHRLNSISAGFLTVRSRQPRENRREYLQELIALIQKHLSVDFVSIFYRNLSGDRLECLATTGLWKPGGEKIPDHAITEASYVLGEGLTGHVFEQGKPAIVQMQTQDRLQAAKYCDFPPMAADDELPYLIFPIRFPSSRTETLSYPHQTLGVIRCAGTRPSPQHRRYRTFNAFQIQTLAFTARQVAPVLETLAANIEREHTISLVVHDLQAPLLMVANAADSLARLPSQLGPAAESTLRDIKLAAFLARNVVELLDFSPTTTKDFSPTRTMLGTIVAKLTTMLGDYAAQSRDMYIQFDAMAERFPPLYVDPHLVERALSNLLLNAVKYGEPHSKITIRERADRSGFYIDVLNQVITFPRDEAELLFHPGHRSKSARQSTRSSGPGLDIAKFIMEMHGGKLLLVTVNNSTVFTMFFPLQLATAPQD